MDTNYKLKDSAKEELVGFNNSALPLGERKDVADLAALAVRTNNPELKKYFEKLPTLEQVNGAQVDSFLATQPALPSFDDLVKDPEAEAKAEAQKVVEASTEDRVIVETGNEVVPVVTPLADEKADTSSTEESVAAGVIVAETAAATTKPARPSRK